MDWLLLILPILLCAVPASEALDNGLAQTPPMGWLAWLRYVYTVDCEKYPDDCINEQLFKRQAEKMISMGFRDAGYEYINIDDCWSEWDRDPVTKKLVADKKRFPGGIKSLARFVHSKGLKLGIYGDAGTKTCEGYPGSKGQRNKTNYWELDAKTFAEWEVDSLKLDGCYNQFDDYETDYTAMSQALNQSGRPILYICSWPAYVHISQKKFPNYDVVQRNCNAWRNWYDITYSWSAILNIIDFYSENQERFKMHNGPGAWNDPDMLVVGSYGLSVDQMRAQMAFWSLWSSPLYMSTDLKLLTPEAMEILQNKHVIAINQDPLGKFGLRVLNTTKDDDGRATRFEVYAKPMAPINNGIHSYAIIYFNRYTLGPPIIFSRKIRQILSHEGLEGANQTKEAGDDLMWDVFDVFDDNRKLARLTSDSNLTLKVNPGGGIRMVKVVPILQTSSLNDPSTNAGPRTRLIM